MKTYKREVLLEELNMHKPKLMSASLQACLPASKEPVFPPFDSPANLAKIGGPVRGRLANEIQAILHLRLSNPKDFNGAVESKRFLFLCAC
jgi:hypothetical protein